MRAERVDVDRSKHLSKPRSRHLGKNYIHTSTRKTPNFDVWVFFLFCFVLFFLSLMTKSQAQMVSLVLKPLKPNLDLISWPNCCFNHSQRHHLNQPVCNFLVNTNELISHTGPPPNPQRTGTLHYKNLCHPFCPKWGPDLLLIAPLPHLHPPPMKTFHFYNPL